MVLLGSIKIGILVLTVHYITEAFEEVGLAGCQ